MKDTIHALECTCLQCIFDTWEGTMFGTEGRNENESS